MCCTPHDGFFKISSSLPSVAYYFTHCVRTQTKWVSENRREMLRSSYMSCYMSHRRPHGRYTFSSMNIFFSRFVHKSWSIFKMNWVRFEQLISKDNRLLNVHHELRDETHICYSSKQNRFCFQLMRQLITTWQICMAFGFWLICKSVIFKRRRECSRCAKLWNLVQLKPDPNSIERPQSCFSVTA